MAKRFIDTGFFKSPFVRGLEGSLKTLYCFIICDCSGAGIWSVDFEIASMYIGHKVSKKDAEIFIKTGKAIDLKDGKWFFPDFIEHQYPKGLQHGNPAQKNFIAELLKYNLLDENLKPLKRPFKGSKVMVKVMEEEKETVKEEDKDMGTKNAIVYPFDTPEFMEQWGLWKKYKLDQHNFKYKGNLSEQGALKKLSEIARTEFEAIKIIHQSIEQGWKGLFKLTENGTKNSNDIADRFKPEDMAAGFERNFGKGKSGTDTNTGG